MNKKFSFIFFILLGIGFLVVLFLVTRGSTFSILEPKGLIAGKERTLLITVTLLSLVVVVPVYISLFTIAWKYRASNIKATYTPEKVTTPLVQVLWWGIPSVIISILGFIMWTHVHELDPHKAIAASTPPMTIQVVSLQWKWLFIYPQQNIATVNYVAFPEKTPITFILTSDAPMNSFWIPQLGGQMYTMPGMINMTHLIADTRGEFRGSTAEISGKGFARMKFMAKSTSREDFDAWVQSVKQSATPLQFTTYTSLAKPSEDIPSTSYAPVENDLYNKILMKYMPTPAPHTNQTTDHMSGMEM
jgi:cytochrome o ubiquinol oxidase subunit 2